MKVCVKVILVVSVVIASLVTILIAAAQLQDDSAQREYYDFNEQGDYALDYAQIARIFGICWLFFLLRLFPHTYSAATHAAGRAIL